MRYHWFPRGEKRRTTPEICRCWCFIYYRKMIENKKIISSTPAVIANEGALPCICVLVLQNTAVQDMLSIKNYCDDLLFFIVILS